MKGSTDGSNGDGNGDGNGDTTDELLESFYEVDTLVSPRYRWAVQRLLGTAFMPPVSDASADGNGAGAAYNRAAMRDKAVRRYGTAVARILAYTKWAATPKPPRKAPEPSRVAAPPRMQASAVFEGLVVQPSGGPDLLTPLLLFPRARTVWLIGKESLGDTDPVFWGNAAVNARRAVVGKLLKQSFGPRGLIMSEGRRQAASSDSSSTNNNFSFQTKKIGVFPLLLALATLAGYHVTDVSVVSEHTAECLQQQTVDGAHADGYRTHAITLSWIGNPLAPLDGVGAPPPLPPLPSQPTPLPDGGTDERKPPQPAESRWPNKTVLYTEWTTSTTSHAAADPLQQPAHVDVESINTYGTFISKLFVKQPTPPEASSDPKSLCMLPRELLADIKARAKGGGGDSAGADGGSSSYTNSNGAAAGSGLAASLMGAEFDLFSDGKGAAEVRNFFAENAALIVQDDSGLPFEQALANFRDVSLMGSFVGPSVVPLLHPDVVNKTVQPSLTRFYELERAAGLVGDLPLAVMSYDKRMLYKLPADEGDARLHGSDAHAGGADETGTGGGNTVGGGAGAGAGDGAAGGQEVTGQGLMVLSKGTSAGSGGGGNGDGKGAGTYAKGMAVAMHAYSASSPDELTFARGDLIALLGMSNADIPILSDGWWFGQLTRGEVGMFPANHARMI